MRMSPRKWAMLVIYGLILSVLLNIILLAIAASKGGKKALGEPFDPFSPRGPGGPRIGVDAMDRAGVCKTGVGGGWGWGWGWVGGWGC
jgi:hypothetical protein